MTLLYCSGAPIQVDVGCLLTGQQVHYIRCFPTCITYWFITWNEIKYQMSSFYRCINIKTAKNVHWLVSLAKVRGRKHNHYLEYMFAYSIASMLKVMKNGIPKNESITKHRNFEQSGPKSYPIHKVNIRCFHGLYY